MAHQHSHEMTRYDRAFAIGVALNAIFIAVEVTFGLMADSLALLADAGHNFSDVISLVVAWGASYLTRLKPTHKRTYGWRKASIMGALLNATILLVALGGIASEAIRRFAYPAPPAGGVIIVVALVGVGINTATALLFVRGRKEDLNIRGAFLHMAADAGVSLGVAIAGAAILVTGWAWLDPLVSLLVVLVILIGTWRLFVEAFNMAVDAVPAGIDVPEIRRYLGGLPGVTDLHDLHIWPMSTTEVALTVHMVKPDPHDDDETIAQAVRELHDQFGIEHVTIQWERGGNPGG